MGDSKCERQPDPDLRWKPLAQWSRNDLDRYHPDKNSTEWLKLLVNPSLALAVSGFYREKKSRPESVVRLIADREFRAGKGDPYLLRVAARWLLRNYSLWNAWVLYWRLLWRGDQNWLDKIGVLIEAVMPRVFVSVWIGMLAICGSSPWPFLKSLHNGSVAGLAGVCLAFSSAYRVVHIGRRSTCRPIAVLCLSGGLTAYGLLLGGVLFGLAARLYLLNAPEVACEIPAGYYVMMPSIGSAVGVILQEFWEDKPISEPL